MLLRDQLRSIAEAIDTPERGDDRLAHDVSR